MNIIHRDVKPENVLILNEPDPRTNLPIAKLLDFGLSKNAGHSVAKTFVGTPCYLAPEVEFTSKGVGGQYGTSADCWSLGSLLYVMLVARFPEFEMNQRTGMMTLKLPASLWGHISESAKSLIVSLMTIDPLSRMNMRETLQHPWLNEFRASDVELDIPALNEMRTSDNQVQRLNPYYQTIQTQQQYQQQHQPQTQPSSTFTTAHHSLSPPPPPPPPYPHQQYVGNTHTQTNTHSHTHTYREGPYHNYPIPTASQQHPQPQPQHHYDNIMMSDEDLRMENASYNQQMQIQHQLQQEASSRQGGTQVPDNRARAVVVRGNHGAYGANGSAGGSDQLPFAPLLNLQRYRLLLLYIATIVF